MNSDCTGTWGCQPSWNCTAFSQCFNGQQARTCIDRNNCGTTAGKPMEFQSCGCTSVWNCGWQSCSEGTVQNYLCMDGMSCNPANATYVASTRPCCIEQWECGSWSECSNSRQNRMCVEITSCGTALEKPVEEQICSVGKFPWLIVIIVVLVLGIGVLVFLLVLKKKPKTNFSADSQASFGQESLGNSPSASTSQYPEIVSYIKEMIAAGSSKQDIKAKLIEAGWPGEVIDQSFRDCGM
jgi:hypothetical protein